MLEAGPETDLKGLLGLRDINSTFSTSTEYGVTKAATTHRCGGGCVRGLSLVKTKIESSSMSKARRRRALAQSGTAIL